MELSPEMKILICNSKKENSFFLKEIFQKSKSPFLIIETDCENCKWMEKAYLPSVIITDFINGDLDSLMLLRENENIPLIIIGDEANAKIMTAVFNLPNVSFVKKSEKEEVIIEAISKSLNTVQ